MLKKAAPDSYGLTGAYVGRIPAEPPVRQADKIELRIDLKVADALDLTVTPNLLARADGVIE